MSHDENFILVVVIMVARSRPGGGTAMSAQDKYTLQVPNGLAFSEFKGIRRLAAVAVIRTGDTRSDLGHPAMINAYRQGFQQRKAFRWRQR